ncbi:MAG: hypothetical protein HY901_17945 [Deltaproteobacteria bacterium]|nr:hypothetical protein [Deltaproteobacteria bacterium]
MVRACLLTLSCAPLIAFAGCAWGPDTSPSTGRCEGALGARLLDGLIDPETSEYHLDGERFVVNLSYLRGAFKATGTTSGVFTPTDESYCFADAGIGGTWSVSEPATRPAMLRASQVKVTDSTPYRLTGELHVENEDGSSLRCSFDVRRGIELEDERQSWDD